MSQSELFAAAPDVIACELEGGAALLDLRTSHYFSLNSVGAVLWQALQTPTSSESLSETVAEHFDITADACRADVDAYLGQLHTRQLVTKANG